jgi:hypothetical protein
MFSAMHVSFSKKLKALILLGWYMLLLNPGNARKKAWGKEKFITDCPFWVRHTWVSCSPPYPGAPNYPAPACLVPPSVLLPKLNAYVAIYFFFLFYSDLELTESSLTQ